MTKPGMVDSLVARLFRQDSQGRLTLGPYGRARKVYVVPADRAERYKRFMLRFYAGLIGAVALGGFMFGSRVAVGVVIPVFVVGYFVYLARFTSDLEAGSNLHSPGPNDILRRMSASHAARPVEPQHPTPVSPAMSRAPAVVVSRRPRDEGTGWSNARSWLGGRPRLGDIPWPRAGPERIPMTHVAWIDLSHLAERVASTPLPRTGALAFFIGAFPRGAECAVIHVASDDAPETNPPAGAPPAYTPYGDVFATTDVLGSRVFPRWPVELTPLEPSTPNEEEDLGIVVDRHIRRRQFFFDASTARKALGDVPLPAFWQSAHHLGGCLQAAVQKLDVLRAQRARYGGSGGALDAFDQGRPAFRKFAGEVERWALSHAPHEVMAPPAGDELRSYFARAKDEFASYAKIWLPGTFNELETASLRALASAEDDVSWAALPPPVRALLDRDYRLPPGGWHQMFGRGLDIQGAIFDHDADHLLLQLVYDDLMEWKFGDMGAYQIWISDADLQRGRWSAAQVTFESH